MIQALLLAAIAVLCFFASLVFGGATAVTFVLGHYGAGLGWFVQYVASLVVMVCAGVASSDSWREFRALRQK